MLLKQSRKLSYQFPSEVLIFILTHLLLYRRFPHCPFPVLPSETLESTEYPGHAGHSLTVSEVWTVCTDRHNPPDVLQANVEVALLARGTELERMPS